MLTQGRAGLEARGCRFAGIACAFGGVDLAYQDYTWMAGAIRVNDVVPVLRGGLEVGGQHVHARLSLESCHLFDPRYGALDRENAALALAYTW
jgi:hypothetical protein